jgi:hypothetical protein
MPLWSGRIALAGALLAAAFGAFAAREALLARMAARGPGGAPPPALARPVAAGGVPRAELVRVALLDGVDRDTAGRLPHYGAACRRGVDLVVDVGFPTVSLPVQSVLWTGLTQQQSGIERVAERIDPPPGSLPAREPSSAAVSESHAFIAQSFGFARAWPAPDLAGAALAEWEAGRFEETALGAVRSDARLVFVHFLRADGAAHRRGRDSPEFAAAAASADRALGRLVAADQAAHGGRSLWIVLSDHGHRAAGGHGGEEPEVRLVRGCVAGGGLAAGAAPRGHLVHLVDLSRALADALGRAPHPASAGRPLYDALLAPEQPGATLPRPGRGRVAAAALLVAAALAASWIAARRSWRLPWWWVIAYLSIAAIESAPTLSNAVIYRPVGRDMAVAALPGLCALAVAAGWGVRTVGPLRVARMQLLLPAALAAACALLAWREPPLVPLWTALLSVSLVLLASGAGVVALACLASLVGRRAP